MSSDLFPTVKSKKHVLVVVGNDVMQALIQDTINDRRSFSYTVSRILEAYYEKQNRLNVV